MFDTILDEQAILGLALGAGVAGMLPIPEIQYLAYLHNAPTRSVAKVPPCNSSRTASTGTRWSCASPAYGYQKGFGGHFHNDNAIGALRDIPGIIIASPSRPDDAAAMMRTCAAVAHATERCASTWNPSRSTTFGTFTRTVTTGGWPRTRAGAVPIGSARTYGDGTDLTIVTSQTALHMSLRGSAAWKRPAISAARRRHTLARPASRRRRLREANATGRVLVVDETRRLPAACRRACSPRSSTAVTPARCRVASKDSFIPLGDAALTVLLSEDTVETAAVKLVHQ